MAEFAPPYYGSAGPQPTGYTAQAVPSTITSNNPPVPAPVEAYPQMRSNTPTRRAAPGANYYFVGQQKAYEGPILVDESNIDAPRNMKAYEGPIYVDDRNHVLGPNDLKDRLLVGTDQAFDEERLGHNDLRDDASLEDRGHLGGAFDVGWNVGHKGVADPLYSALCSVGSAIYDGAKPVGYGIAGGVGMVGLSVGKFAAFSAGTVSGLGYGLTKPVVSVAHEHVVQPLGYGASAVASYTADTVSSGVSSVGGAVVDGASALGGHMYSAGEKMVDGAADGISYVGSGLQPTYANQPRALEGAPSAYSTAGVPTGMQRGPSLGTLGAAASRGRYIEPTRSYVDRSQPAAVSSYRT